STSLLCKKTSKLWVSFQEMSPSHNASEDNHFFGSSDRCAISSRVPLQLHNISMQPTFPGRRSRESRPGTLPQDSILLSASIRHPVMLRGNCMQFCFWAYAAQARGLGPAFDRTCSLQVAGMWTVYYSEKYIPPHSGEAPRAQARRWAPHSLTAENNRVLRWIWCATTCRQGPQFM
ncbi:hypothetical protein EV401DRAFT_2021499, partial [Pisolithus croceorrhizus]